MEKTMKRVVIAAGLVALGFSTVFAQTSKKPASAKETTAKKETTKSETQGTVKMLSTEKDSLSYALGVNIATSFSQQKIDIDVDVLATAMKDVLAGGKTQLDEQQVMAVLMQFQQKMQARQSEEAAKAGEKNRVEGEKFLAENKKKEGVQVTPSGLQYKVITMGTGEKPKASDQVTVHYTGRLITGEVFDSSVDRGEPATFPLNGVIAGWTEGVQLMPVGSKFEFYIPSDLAYGPRGAGGLIGPDATLVFEVELISINK